MQVAPPNPMLPSLPWPGGGNRTGLLERDVPGWNDRSYLLHLPTGYDRTRPTPLVVVLHGHGDNAERERRQVSPHGDPADPHSFDSIADREGFVVVYANGTRFGHFGGRFWNADHLPGGPDGIWQATAGAEPYIDDSTYMRDLLDDVGRVVNVDGARVFATGMSNGAAMTHRLAMELPGRFAAIAAIAGPNQMVRTNAGLPLATPTAMLEIHGTADTVWPIGGGHVRGKHGDYQSVAGSIDWWRRANHATGAPTTDWLPDVDPGDHTRVRRESWRGEHGADVELLTIVGGGHTWPDGEGRGRNPLAGHTTHDFSGNEAIWAFFRAHARTRD